MRIFCLLLTLVSFKASADYAITKLYCVEQTNPTQNQSKLVIITDVGGRLYANVGAFEQENGGMGINDLIVCPYARVTMGTDPVVKNGAVVGYQSNDFSLVLNSPLGSSGSVNALLSISEMYKLNNLPMTCVAATDFPYVCTPHPFHGE